MSRLNNHLHLLGEGLNRVSGRKPGRLDVVLSEQLEQAGNADFTGKKTAGDIIRGVLTAI